MTRAALVFFVAAAIGRSVSAQAQPLPDFIPPVTDADRQAAFPPVEGHAVHDQALNAFVLFDRLEWRATKPGAGFKLDTSGWVGRDRQRFWFRAEGDGDGELNHLSGHALYGRHFARWWDVVAGIRQDLRPGSPQTWAALGVQGLAPYWFEVEATAYVGASGRTEARLRIEYDLLITNRLVLQPLGEIAVAGKTDPERRIGAGLIDSEGGFRLRYEIRRELAPYVGIVWTRRYGTTAAFARADGNDPDDAQFVAGGRIWF